MIIFNMIQMEIFKNEINYEILLIYFYYFNLVYQNLNNLIFNNKQLNFQNNVFEYFIYNFIC